MKKTYTTPTAKKVDFCYREQIVAASGAFGKVCIKYTHHWYSGNEPDVEACHDSSGCITQIIQPDQHYIGL